MLHGIWQCSVQFEVQNRCNAILSVFLMVGIILLWYCWNSFSFMMVVLFGSVICSSVVMLSSSSRCRYFLFGFGVIVGWLVAFCSHIVARGVSVCGCDVLSVCMCT
jgi:hypothetical protein